MTGVAGRPYRISLRNEPPASLLSGLPTDVRQILASTQMLFLDVDGVLTDGSRTLDHIGQAFVSFSGRDGLGILMLAQAGVDIAFMSAMQSEIVEQRARELKVSKIWMNVSNKGEILRDYMQNSTLPIVFVGDDLWDLEAIRVSSLGIAVGDAVPEVLQAADIICAYPGGRGAVRQVCDLLLEARGADRLELLASL